MPDIIADFFLLFSHVPAIACILLFYWIAIGRSFFIQSLSLTMLDLMINVALKGTFKIPLGAWLHEGYAFPSGHMQLTSIFYLWVALHVPSTIFRLCMFVICIGQGAALIHYQYHTIQDVVGGFIVALLLIIIFQGAIKLFKQQTPWFLIAFASICGLYNLWIYRLGVPIHAVYAYYILVGVLIAERIGSRNGKKMQSWQFESIQTIKVPFL